MSRTKAISMGDIAARVGVSRMTVSLALRGDGRISEPVRNRVRQAADDLGYVPNPRIGRLMAETARAGHSASGEVLAFVTTEPTRDGWKQFDPADTYRTIVQRAAEHGYIVEPWWIADPDLTHDRINQILEARGIKGMIIPNISRQYFSQRGGTLPIHWDQFCAVEIGGGLRKPRLHEVRHDHVSGMFMALHELECLGYQRIGLCLRSEDDLRAHHRWTGAHGVWRLLRGHSSDLEPMIVDELRRDDVRAWIQRKRLEAVIGLRDLPLDPWGYAVPDDIGYAALHLWGTETARVSGIDQHDADIAESAVDLLVAQLHRHQRGYPKIAVQWVIEGQWIARATTRQIRPVAHVLPKIEDEWIGRTDH